MYVKAVRGAVKIDSDSEELIDNGVSELVGDLMFLNGIEERDIVSIYFTITRDLQKKNPAASLRKNGFSGVPLLCSQEPVHEGALPRVIRVLVTVNRETAEDLKPVYINGAEKLRPDISFHDR